MRELRKKSKYPNMSLKQLPADVREQVELSDDQFSSAGHPLPTRAEMRECIECLYGVVSEVLTQIGRVALNDYERLNRGMILAEKILPAQTVKDTRNRK